MAAQPAIDVNTAGGIGTVSLSASGLPDNLTLTDNGDGTAQITGTVAEGEAAGSPYTVTVTATDSSGQTDTETFDIAVSPSETQVGQGIELDSSTGYVDTPDAAALDITGDIDLRFDCAPATNFTSVTIGFIGTWSLGNRTWYMRHSNNDELQLGWSTDGSIGTQVLASSTADPGFTDDSRKQVRATLDVDNGSGGYDVTFYTRNPTSDLTDNDGWVQLGTVVTGGSTTSIAVNTGPCEVGRFNNTAHLQGTVYQATAMDGINGTVVANLSADDFTVGDTALDTAVDSAGRTWTLRGDSTVVA